MIGQQAAKPKVKQSRVHGENKNWAVYTSFPEAHPLYILACNGFIILRMLFQVGWIFSCS